MVPALKNWYWFYVLKCKNPIWCSISVTDAINDAGDVFVVSTESIQTACDNTDHNYSITVQQEAEVEIGSDIEPEETDQEIVILQGQSWQTGFFWSVLKDRIYKLDFVWRWFWNSETWEILPLQPVFMKMLTFFKQ